MIQSHIDFESFDDAHAVSSLIADHYERIDSYTKEGLRSHIDFKPFLIDLSMIDFFTSRASGIPGQQMHGFSGDVNYRW
jgi:hypothetical protein